MKKLFYWIALISSIAVWFLPPTHAQVAPSSVVFGTFNATNNFGTGTAVAKYVSLPYPIYSSGTLYMTWNNITGSPSGCSAGVNFSQGVTSQAIANYSTNISGAVTPGTTLQIRLNTLNSIFLTYSTAGASYSCTNTYPTSGTISMEFVPDPQPMYQYSHITSATNTVLKPLGVGFLHTIVVNNPGTSVTVTVFDNTTCTGTIIASITNGTAPQTYGPYDVLTTAGLCVTTGGTLGDVTVTYR